MKNGIRQVADQMVIVIALTGMAIPAQADAFMKQISRTEPMTVMGQEQPGTCDTSDIWFSKDKAHMTTELGAVILRADLGTIYVVNSSAGTYAEIPLGQNKEMSSEVVKAMEVETKKGKERPGDIDQMMKKMEEHPEAAKMMEAVKGMMGSRSGMSEMSAKVTATDETKIIREWDTRLWLVELNVMMSTNSQRVWATKDIDIDYTLFQEMAGAILAVMPGTQEIVEEMKKIEGVPVLTETEILTMGMTVKQTTEVIEYHERPSPPGIYDLDKSLNQVSLLELGMGQP